MSKKSMTGTVQASKFFLIASIALVALLVVVYLAPLYFSPTPQTPNETLLSVKTYVSQHISELSPEKEVLGGKFYVTRIEVSDGKGTVEYEDGHIALVADFTYTASDREGINVTSFTVRR